MTTVLERAAFAPLQGRPTFPAGHMLESGLDEWARRPGASPQRVSRNAANAMKLRSLLPTWRFRGTHLPFVVNPSGHVLPSLTTTIPPKLFPLLHPLPSPSKFFFGSS